MKPALQVITPAGNVDERRLISVDTFRLLSGIGADVASDDLVERTIDDVLDQAAGYCKLARAGTYPRTLAQETVRATWSEASFNHAYSRGWRWDDRAILTLPWRVPITALSITEGGAALTQGVDYELIARTGEIQRLGDGFAGAWAWGGIVAEYTAGWVTEDADSGEKLPPSLVAEIINQVRVVNEGRSRELSLRSEDVPDVWSGTYNVAGGDTVAASGRLRSLELALDEYRAPLTI